MFRVNQTVPLSGETVEVNDVEALFWWGLYQWFPNGAARFIGEAEEDIR